MAPVVFVYVPPIPPAPGSSGHSIKDFMVTMAIITYCLGALAYMHHLSSRVSTASKLRRGMLDPPRTKSSWILDALFVIFFTLCWPLYLMWQFLKKIWPEVKEGWSPSNHTAQAAQAEERVVESQPPTAWSM